MNKENDNRMRNLYASLNKDTQKSDRILENYVWTMKISNIRLILVLPKPKSTIDYILT